MAKVKSRKPSKAPSASKSSARKDNSTAKKSPPAVRHKDVAAKDVAAKDSAAKKPVRTAVKAQPARLTPHRGKPAKVAAKPAPQTLEKVGSVNRAPQATLPKVQTSLKSKDLEFFRDLLLAKRREIIGDVQSMEEEALRSTTGSNLSNLPIHMADMGSDNYEQEFTLGLVEKDRQLLREINIALAKIRDGSYGVCEGTGKPIARARLEVKPWARYSIEHARQLENGLGRR